jgi:DNA-binding transcriptional MerR regulator
MAKTIKEIAAECKVSEQAIRGWCRRNHVAKDAKGSFAISESQKRKLYLHYLGVARNEVAKPAKASCETYETSETVLISMLQKELDRKDAQLSAKDEQIRELNARLSECSAALLAAQETARAAQALHAGTMQQQLAGEEDRAADSGTEEQAVPNKRRWFSRFFRR